MRESIHIYWGITCFISNFCSVISSLLERTPPPVKAAKPERTVRAVILPPGRPVFRSEEVGEGMRV